MPLPSSGPISAQMIRGQLTTEGVEFNSANLNLNDPKIRDLADKPQGPISYADFYGKYYYDHFLSISSAAHGPIFPINNYNAIKTAKALQWMITTTEPLPGYREVLPNEMDLFAIYFIAIRVDDLINVPINAGTKFTITDGVRSERFGLKYSSSGYHYEKETNNLGLFMSSGSVMTQPFDTNFKILYDHYINALILKTNQLSNYMDLIVTTNGAEVFRKKIKIPKRFRRYYYRTATGKNIIDAVNSTPIYITSTNDVFFTLDHYNVSIRLNSKYNLTQKEIDYIRNEYPGYHISGTY